MTPLSHITQQLDAGLRLNSADADALAATADVLTLGMLADEIRRRKHASRVTFVRVTEFPLNGAGGLDRDQPGMVAGEWRLVGIPASVEQARRCVEGLAAHKAAVPLSGFSAVDLLELAARESRSFASVLDELHRAGLDLIAEAPIDRPCDWRTVFDEVAASGLEVGCVTVHSAPLERWPELYRTLVELQDALGTLRVFAPLPRQTNAAQPSTGYEDVRRVALARILVDNVPSIQIDWAAYGPKLAQVALTFGADDLDAVLLPGSIEAGSRRTPLEELRRNILALSFEPIERNGRFEPLAR